MSTVHTYTAHVKPRRVLRTVVCVCGVCAVLCGVLCGVLWVGVSHLDGGGRQLAYTHTRTHTHATHTGFAVTVQGVSDHTLGAGLCGSMMTLPARKPCTIAMGMHGSCAEKHSRGLSDTGDSIGKRGFHI